MAKADTIIRATGRARKHQIYKLADGTRVPGGSTLGNVIQFGTSDGLIRWGIRLDHEGIDFLEYNKEAADFGNCFHRVVECRHNQVDFPAGEYPGNYVEPAHRMADNFFALLSDLGLVMCASEIQGVSEEERWGGTLDLVLARASAPDVPCILGDLKSSNSVRLSHKVQVGGAYVKVFEAIYGKRPEKVVLFRAERNPPHPVTAHWIDDEMQGSALALARLARDAKKHERNISRLI